MEIQIYRSLLIYIVLFFNCSEHVFGHGSAGTNLTHGVSSLTINSPDDVTYYNVKDFGAKGDGVTDDSQAFQGAMVQACNAGGVMLVPAGYTFLLQTIKFDGTSCQPGITVQIEGKIVAPPTISEWKFVDFQWIQFSGFTRGITIKGNGIVDGQGEPWWSLPPALNSDEETQPNQISKPNAMRITGSNYVTVTGITIQNSPFFHLYIDVCQGTTIFDFSVWSPQNSPNTDGIHLSHTQHVDIHNATLACGDDCISIQTGCYDVKIYDVNCGPGHGYSIGSLGLKNVEAEVSFISVYDSTVSNSLTGVRIKTWKGSYGYARNITFSNIIMSNVHTPIVIDQEYCGGQCGTSDQDAVAISGVRYESITGTYTSHSVALRCSESVPCRDLTMASIDLQPSNSSIDLKQPNCTNAYGNVLTNTTPPLNNCLLPAAS